MLYSYSGPVFDENDRELDNVSIQTNAVSLKQAISRIRYKLARSHFRNVVYINNNDVIENTSKDNPSASGGKPVIVDPDYNFEETDLDEKFTFEDAYNSLNELYDRKTLVKDIIYSSVEEFLEKQEIITKISKIDTEKMLQAFSEGGYIDGADMIRIPKGTEFTYKGSKEYKNKTYDIYHIKGSKYCLVAICTDDMVNLFGDNF